MEQNWPFLIRKSKPNRSPTNKYLTCYLRKQ